MHEALSLLSDARVPAGPILSIADIMAERQYAERGMFQKARPPSGGGPEVTLPAMLPLLSRTPGGTRWAGPALGEHTEQVLMGDLGYSRQRLDELRAAGAV